MEDAKPDLLARLWNEIRELKLESHVAELETRGYTIVPPEVAAPLGFTDRLREACLDIVEKRTGSRPDINKSIGVGDPPTDHSLSCILFEDRVFEEALMQPVPLTLATYLLGWNCILSSMTCLIKGPGKSHFGLHTDTVLPSPLPRHALVCNMTWLLTDYDREGGATAIVPGSHHWCRTPEAHEANPNTHPQAIPIEARAGSFMIWHGNTWHGAFDRTTEGLRMGLPMYMARPNIRAHEDLIGRVPQEMLDRNPPRFAQLAQQGITMGFRSPDDAAKRFTLARERTKDYMTSLGLDAATGQSQIYSLLTD